MTFGGVPRGIQRGIQRGECRRSSERSSGGVQRGKFREESAERPTTPVQHASGAFGADIFELLGAPASRANGSGGWVPGSSMAVLGPRRTISGARVGPGGIPGFDLVYIYIYIYSY